MSIEAVLFDIGGVLELTPPTGWQERWAAELGLAAADFDARLDPIFLAGSTGARTLARSRMRSRAPSGSRRRRSGGSWRICGRNI